MGPRGAGFSAWIVAVGLCALSCCPAAAAVVVTTTADSGPGSLREAVDGAVPGEIVTFAPEVTGVIRLTSGPLIVRGEITILGPGNSRLAVSGGNVHRVLEVSIGARAILRDLAVEAGSVIGGGGGVLNRGWLRLEGCAVRGNRSLLGGAGDSHDPPDHGGNGGGILNLGELELLTSEVANNSAEGLGGGIMSHGALMAIQSTIRDNQAESDGGGFNLGAGTSTWTNSTISGNTTAFGVASGGWVGPAAEATLAHCTVYGNAFTGLGRSALAPQVVVEGEGSGLHSEGRLELSHTIVAGNLAEDEPIDLSGSLVSLGYNLVQSSGSLIMVGSMVGNLFDVDPLVGPLADNGGATLTHALSESSPAIDAGSASAETWVDQRGYPRSICRAVDLGAVEFQRPHFVPPADLEIAEDAPPTDPLLFTVDYAFADPDELEVTAQSSEPWLIGPDGIELSGSGRYRTIVLVPEPDANGTTRVTVRVEALDGRACERSFQVTVFPCNDPPTLDPLDDLPAGVGNGTLEIPLTGVSPGPASESGQRVSLWAVSDNPMLIPHPEVVYQAPDPTGWLRLRQEPGAWGRAEITVFAEDDGDTGGCNQSRTTQSFAVLVPQPIPPPCDFEIRQHPQDQAVCALSDVTIEVDTTGCPASELSYQWHHGPVPIPQATRRILRLGNVTPEDAGSYWVLISNGTVNRRSACANLTITPNLGGSLRLLQHPEDRFVSEGDQVSFEVSATSCSQVSYQWYLNRRPDGTGYPLLDRDQASLPTVLPAHGPLSGAMTQVLTLAGVTASDGGDYFVVVRDATDSLTSHVARLVVGPMTSLGCRFSPDQPAEITGLAGSVRLGDLESPAPDPIGQSAWVRWRSATGTVMTFTTAGSPLNTRLALHTLDSVDGTRRVLLATDEDSGGHGTSLIRSRVEAGRDYWLQLSAVTGSVCDSVLQWSESVLWITVQPADRFLQIDSTEEGLFSVEVETSGPVPEFTWWKYGISGNSRALGPDGLSWTQEASEPSRYRSTLLLSNIQPSEVGYYYVVARSGTHQVRSRMASLEVYSEGALDSSGLGFEFPPRHNDQLLADPVASAVVPRPLRRASSFQAGRVGFWILDSLVPADSGVNDPPYCSRPAEHSPHARWVPYTARGSGWVFLDTVGSDLPARLAVYRVPDAPSTSADPMNDWVAVACDAGGAADGLGAAVYFEVAQDEQYWVVVDGPPQRGGHGATADDPAEAQFAWNSRIRLNWNVPREGDRSRFRWIRLRARAAEASGALYGVLGIDTQTSGIGRLLTVFRATHYGNLAPVHLDYPDDRSATFTFVPSFDFLIAVDDIENPLHLFWKLDAELIESEQGPTLAWTGRRLGLPPPRPPTTPALGPGIHDDPLGPPNDPDGCGPWEEPQDELAPTPFTWAPTVDPGDRAALTGPRTYRLDRVTLWPLPEGTAFFWLRPDLADATAHFDIYTNPPDLGRAQATVKRPALTAQ